MNPDRDLMDMLRGLAGTVRPAIDQYLQEYQQTRRVEDLRRSSLTDPLTGLGNRRALETHLPVGLYSLVSIDLDHFKAVNDTFGHAAGDHVLSQVTSVIASSVRNDDSVYRLGGEEFLVVLPHTNAERAHHVAERIRVAVAGLDLTGQAPGGSMTVSLGVTTTEDGDEATFAETLKLADAALYASKAGGRNQVTVTAHTPVPR